MGLFFQKKKCSKIIIPDCDGRLKTRFSKYSLQKTLDGSWSIYSDRFFESAHSQDGAWSESLYNFYQACEISTLQNPTIFDIGFGLGASVATVVSGLGHRPFKIVSFEIDRDLAMWAILQGPYCDYFKGFHISGSQESCRLFRGKNRNMQSIEIIFGDARKNLSKVSQNYKKVDAIFQDAYSPSKNHELWTLSWFQELAEYAHKNCLLATYSSSVRMRIALAKAGWFLKNRKGFGHKKTMTLASLKHFGDEDCTDEFLGHKHKPLEDEKL